MDKCKFSDYVYIIRAFIALKDGTHLYARQRGKRGSRIAVPVERRN